MKSFVYQLTWAFIISVFCPWSAICQEDQPDLKSWALEFKEDKKLAGLNIPQRLMVVEGIKAYMRFSVADFDGSESRQGFVRFVSNEQVRWAASLNRSPRKSKKSKKRIVVDSMIANHADALLVASSSGKWEYHQRKNRSLVVSFSSKSDDSLSVESIGSFLAGSLGFNAIVLDSKLPYVLVGSLFSDFTSDPLQALALGNSAKTYKIDKRKNQGVGLLNLMESDGAFGLFKVVFIDESIKDLDFATKLLVEQAK